MTHIHTGRATITKASIKVVCAAAKKRQLDLMDPVFKRMFNIGDRKPTEQEKAEILSLVKKFASGIRTEAGRSADAKLATALRKWADTAGPAFQELLALAPDGGDGPKGAAFESAGKAVANICGWDD